jgi:periplasmic divalent cation tolerance protein
MTYRVVLSTINDRDQAENLAQTLLEERLVACINILGPLTSLYHWQGEITRDQEFLLIMKTTASREAALLSRVQELHPYDIPEVIVVPIETGTPSYLGWIAATVGEHA